MLNILVFICPHEPSLGRSAINAWQAATQQSVYPHRNLIAEIIRARAKDATTIH